MIKNIEILKGVPHIHNSILIERINEKDYIIDGEFPCQKEHVIKIMNFMSDATKFSESFSREIYYKLYEELGMDYHHREALAEENYFLEEILEDIRSEFDPSKCVTLGKEYKGGKHFGVDMPIFTYEGVTKYLPISSPDHLSTEYSKPLSFVMFIAKVYFWDHLADKSVWEREILTGRIHRKKKTFYKRDSENRIVPVVIEDENGNILENVFYELKESNVNSKLIDANRMATDFNKYDNFVMDSKFELY